MGKLTGVLWLRLTRVPWSVDWTMQRGVATSVARLSWKFPPKSPETSPKEAQLRCLYNAAKCGELAC